MTTLTTVEDGGWGYPGGRATVLRLRGTGLVRIVIPQMTGRGNHRKMTIRMRHGQSPVSIGLAGIVGLRAVGGVLVRRWGDAGWNVYSADLDEAGWLAIRGEVVRRLELTLFLGSQERTVDIDFLVVGP